MNHHQCDLSHSQDPGIPDLKFNRTISATLPAAELNTAPTFPGAHGGISQLDSNSQRHAKRPPTHKAPTRNIKKILNSTNALEEQRVRDNDIRIQQQRVKDNTPIITVPLVPCITNAPPILQAQNPTAKRTLNDTPRQNNTLGGVAKIIRPPTCVPVMGESPRKQAKVIQNPAAQAAAPNRRQLRTFCLTGHECFNHPQISYSRHNIHTTCTCPICQHQECNMFWTLCKPHGPSNHRWNNLQLQEAHERPSNCRDLANHIQKRFWWNGTGMQQDRSERHQCNVWHDKSGNCKRIGSRQKITYANPVVDHRPQKEDPNRIWVTAGRNLIQCELELSVRITDINTAKLYWNSVVSTEDARYMCLDIKNFYLTTALKYYEYMQIPLS